MKKKQSFMALLLALLMALSLSACGGSSYAGSGSSSPAAGNYAMDSSKPEMTVEAPSMEDGLYNSSSSGAVIADQKMIYTADLTLETTEFDAAAAALTELTEACGGYFESTSMSERSAGYRWANYTVRVPQAQFNAFLTQAGQLAHVTWQSTGQENITEVYYDTAGRLETQKIKLKRLQALLEQAENMEDIITIESAISETEWSIENLSGTLRHYDALVDYSTITVSLQEVYRLSNTEAAPVTFGERLGNSFLDGLRAFGSWLEDVAVSLAYSWLWLLVLAAVVVLVVVIVRRLRRRKAAKKAAKKAAEETARQAEAEKKE